MTLPATPPRALLIDLDGTLLDTLGDFTAILAATLAEFGRPALPPAVVESLVGRGSEHLLRGALAATGPAEAVAALEAPAWHHYQRHARALNGRAARLYPGVAEALAQARAAGLRLACVTNKPAEFAEDLLQRFGLRPAFEHLVGGDTLPHKKPRPEPLWAACEALGVAPAEAWMLGDSRHDVQAARAAGCPVVLLAHGYNHGQPAEEAGADAVLAGWDGLFAGGMLSVFPRPA